MATFRLARRPNLPMPFTSLIRDAEEMQNRLSGFFDDKFGRDLLQPIGWIPAVEIVENDSELLITAEVPGMAPKDVKVEFNDGVLTISGEKTEEKKSTGDGDRYHLVERSYGSFQRAFTLPPFVDVDKINAEVKDGVLTLRLPKTAAAKTKGRLIEVKAK
jgi:HSP20 family protein